MLRRLRNLGRQHQPPTQLLPDDIWILLARDQLALFDILSLSSVNKHLHAILGSESVWGAIFHRLRGATCLKVEYEELICALSERPQRNMSFSNKCRLALSWRSMLVSRQHITLPKYDFTFRILMVGESGTGKTSLLYRFIDDEFIDLRNTTFGVDFAIKTVMSKPGIVEPKSGKLQIWDTSGRERFSKIMESYYASSHAVMVTFDVQNAQSFFVAQQRCRHMQKRSRSTPTEKPFLILVGTKIDLENTRTVSRTQAEYAAERVGAMYVETSAKTGVGVEQAFCVSGSRALRKMYFDAHVPQNEVEEPTDLVASSGESPAVVESSHFKSFMSYTFEYFLRRFSSS